MGAGLNNQGNLAAISRTSDALGFGGVHCIDGKKPRSSKGRHSAGAAQSYNRVVAVCMQLTLLHAQYPNAYKLHELHPHVYELTKIDGVRCSVPNSLRRLYPGASYAVHAG